MKVVWRLNIYTLCSVCHKLSIFLFICCCVLVHTKPSYLILKSVQPYTSSPCAGNDWRLIIIWDVIQNWEDKTASGVRLIQLQSGEAERSSATPCVMFLLIMLRHICSILKDAQDVVLLCFLLLFLVAGHIPDNINIPRLPCSINTCYSPLAFCSTIKLPLVLLMIELWSKSWVVT